MSIEPVFLDKFEQAAAEAYAGGLKAAPYAGMGSAIGNALTYAADGQFSPMFARSPVEC